ncbi:MAG: membrane-bound lytic murein transglycosylase MltF [Methylophilaceae bacterium]
MLKKTLILGFTLLAFSACNNTSDEPDKKSVKRDENVITFVTLNSPNTYFVNSDKEFAGLEYDLAKAFLKFTGSNKQIKFLVADSIEQVIATIVNGEADIAAADLTVTSSRKTLIDFSIPYQDVQQQVIYSKSFTRRPAKKVSGLIGKKIVVPAASSFVERLQKIKHKEPELTWIARKTVDSETLIEQLAYGHIEYTVADSHLVSVLKNHYPNLRVSFSLGDPEKIAWGFAKTDNPKLLLEANAFFSHIKHNGTLRNLIDRYHGNSKRLNPIDINTFLARRNTRLPQYVKLFKEAQEVTGLDWRLLASLSYQESHWDTFSTSPTKVRGLMMLTEATSDRMGVTDRLDPKQSIPAGAKYVNLMIDTVPDRVPEPDRTYMALASYNVGYAHVEDARVLAQRLGLSPNSWVDVKKALLKLRDPKHYSKAKYGYCRCAQPVVYVESIRSYYNIMTRIEPPYEPQDIDPFKIASK